MLTAGIDWHILRQQDGFNRRQKEAAREAGSGGGPPAANGHKKQYFLYRLSNAVFNRLYSDFDMNDHFSKNHINTVIKVLMKYDGTTYGEFLSYLTPLQERAVNTTLTKMGAWGKTPEDRIKVMDARLKKVLTPRASEVVSLPLDKIDHDSIYHEDVMSELKSELENYAKDTERLELIGFESDFLKDPFIRMRETLKFPLRNYCKFRRAYEGSAPSGASPLIVEYETTTRKPKEQVPVKISIDRVSMSPIKYTFADQTFKKAEDWETELRREVYSFKKQTRLWEYIEDNPRYTSLHKELLEAHKELLDNSETELLKRLGEKFGKRI